MGLAHANSMPDTLVYAVCFPDRRTKELATNLIAKAVYAQCDTKCNHYILWDSIVDCWRDSFMAMSQNNQVMIADGKKIV